MTTGDSLSLLYSVSGQQDRDKGVVATPSGFEPPISTLTGWRVRPLHHGAVRSSVRAVAPLGNPPLETPAVCRALT